MARVKLSLSVLSKWTSYNYEEAIAAYVGRSLPKTPQIQLGLLKDDLWSRFAVEKKELHSELGGGKLTNPIVQQKYQKLIPLGKHEILWRGIPDCIDEGIDYEFKCGWTSVTNYMSSSLQLKNYKFLVPSLKKGVFLCYNPYRQSLGKGVKYLSNADSEFMLEWIITHGSDFIMYLESQRLLIDYKGA